MFPIDRKDPSMRMLLRSTMAALIGLFLLPTYPAGAEEGTHSPNVTHVLNHPHFIRSLDGQRGGGGTDIEFVTLEVIKRDASGNPVCVTNPGGRCKKNRQGIIYVTEIRDFALAGSYDNGLQIVDITTPTSPTTVAVYDCWIRQGDVQVFQRDGRTYATYTHDDPYNRNVDTQSTCYQEAAALGDFGEGVNPAGTFILDVTDPYDPTTVAFISEPRGSHNQTVAPGGNYLYNSNSDLNAKNFQIEVYDIRDLSNPQHAYTLNTQSGLSSHDITFNEDGTRAYSAAITHTLVIDTTDQAQPRIIGRIIDPAINIHHQADPVTLEDPLLGERTFLVVTDELAGAAGNAVCPGGGLHVYDITGSRETSPVKVGVWNMPEVRFTGTGNLTCTSHVLRMYPDQQLMTIAWYNAGVRVVDISGLAGISVGVDEGAGNVGQGMKEIGYYYFPNSDTWSVKTNRIEEDGSFYFYGNDLNRGLDVYRFEADAQIAAEGGTWFSAEQYVAYAQASGILGSTTGQGPYCLYRGVEAA
jgi:hypothetical protein